MLSFREFLDYAEQLYQDALDKGSKRTASPYLIGSILNSWMSIESFINNMLQDFAVLPEDLFTVHERGFLEEKQVKFATEGSKAGTFTIEKRDEFRRIEDKILFLLAKFGKSKTMHKGTHIWQRFQKVKEKRNALSHPKRNKDVKVTTADAKEALEVAKNVIALLSKEVWHKQIKW